MAKGKGAATASATTTPAETAEEKSTRVGALHAAHAAFIKEQTGVDVTPEQVFAVYSTRVRFRKSEGYQTEVRAAKAAEKEAREKAKAEAAEAREKARAEKAAAKEAAAAKKAETPKGGKGKQTSQEALAEASTDSGTTTAKAKKTGSTKGKAKADKPF